MPLYLEDCELFCRLVFDMDCTPSTSLSMIALWRWLEVSGNPPVFSIIPRLINAENPELVRVLNETEIVLRYFSVLNNPPPVLFLPQQLAETRRMISERQFVFLIYIIYLEVVNVGYAADQISRITFDLHNILGYLDLNRATDLNRFMRHTQNPWVRHHTRRVLFIVFVDQERNRITEEELRAYFHRRCEDENCIESVFMGRIHPPLTQPWYAHVVFRSDDTINTWILQEQDQAELWLDDEKGIVAGRFYDMNLRPTM